MRLIHMASLIVLMFMGCSNKVEQPMDFYNKLNILPIQAHRGGGLALPENTLETFETTWSWNIIPEADIRTTSDDIIVCMHDDTVGRVAPDASEQLKKLKFEELDLKTVKSLDVGSYRGKPGERIPTLEEVFSVMQGHPEKLMYLDYKHIDMDRLAALVHKYRLEKQIIFTTKEHNLIIEWKKRIPESLTMIWIGGSLQNKKDTFSALQKTKFEGLTTLQIHVKLDKSGQFTPNAEYLKTCQSEVEQYGVLFQVLPWKINNPEVYQKLMDIGVRSFATDYSEMTVSVYNNYLKNRKN